MKTMTLLLMTALIAPLTGCDVAQAYLNGADRAGLTNQGHLDMGELSRKTHLQSGDGPVVCDPPRPTLR